MKCIAAALIPLAAVAACSDNSRSTVTGEIFLADELLTDAATLTVQLVDATVADAPGDVIDSQVFTVDGDEFPIAYELEYDADDIVDSHLYVVEARVDLGDDLLAINDTLFPAVTNDARTDVDVTVIVVES